MKANKIMQKSGHIRCNYAVIVQRHLYFAGISWQNGRVRTVRKLGKERPDFPYLINGFINVLVHIYNDGSVSTGAVEMSQGLLVTSRIVAARARGIHEQRIHIRSIRTQCIAKISPTAASTDTDHSVDLFGSKR